KRTNALFSIQFDLIFKTPINGDDLILGNDFDSKLRLPPGSNLALSIVKYFIDPGLEADISSERPWAFGPALSSVNIIKSTPIQNSDGNQDLIQHPESFPTIEIPVIESLKSTSMSFTQEAVRRKWFLTKSNRKAFDFAMNSQMYSFDFFNGYLDFNKFALKLPGWGNLNVMPFWDGQPLRYILKTRDGTLVAVVVFELFEKTENGI
ncbi:hypothetical protein HK096_003397, partial [Nowakowskiella sp. JEL0078]